MKHKRSVDDKPVKRVLVKFSLNDGSTLEFESFGYDFEFLCKSLPSMTMSHGEPIVPINETFNISKGLDEATVSLATICARGIVVPSVDVVVEFNDGSNRVFTYSMKQARIQSHCTESLHDYDPDLWEHFKMSFVKIEWTFQINGKIMSGNNSLDSGVDRGLHL